MKYLKLVLILILAIAALGIVGCGEDDDNNTNTGPYIFDPTNPADANISGIDWAVIATNYGDYDKDNTESAVFIMPMYDSIWTLAYPFVNDISLTINGVSITLSLFGYDGIYMPVWYGEVSMPEGETYPFTLNVTELNGTGHTYSADLKTIFTTDTFTYQNYYVPGEALNFSWSLPGSNQYQMATASSYAYDWINDTEYEDEYSVELSNTLRTFSFPANCVNNYGDYTDYYFSIDQYNQAINGRFLAMSTYSDYMDYYSYKSEQPKISMEKHILRMIKTLKSK
ncbi:MAG: hypothetical protein JXR56_08770 [Candidatus Cloacimonetes bacterium]|nr:hypothetical protein [Candidatus Cloacimonadota bacterium]